MKIRAGTRGSALALCQTEMVGNALTAAHTDLEIEVVEIKTLGDRKQGTPEASKSDKKDWVIDLEEAIVRGDIDLAIHSGKDIPIDIEPGTTLLPVLSREDPFDTFVGQVAKESGRRIRFADVPQDGTIGTASLRRRAQLLRLHGGLDIIEHRGNVPTRLRKLDENLTISGIILARAGLKRLGHDDPEMESLGPPEMIPALNQGMLVVQFREDRVDIRDLLKPLVCIDAYPCWEAERAVAEVIEGDCKSAIGIYAEIVGDEITLCARVMTPDGSECVEVERRGSRAEGRALGLSAGNELLDLGARDIIEKSHSFEFPPRIENAP